MFVHLISNENDLFFTCSKSSNTIKISFVKVSFAKMKLFRFKYNRFSYLEPDQRLVHSFTYAASEGDIITVDRFLREGMPVDADDHRSATALRRAIMFNRTDVIKRLVDEGADVNRQTRYGEETPLHLAARHNKTEAVRLLLDNGEDINLKNYSNKTPLDEARKGSEVESLLLQLQQSAP